MAAEVFTLIGLATVVLLGVTRWWEERQSPEPCRRVRAHAATAAHNGQASARR